MGGKEEDEPGGGGGGAAAAAGCDGGGNGGSGGGGEGGSGGGGREQGTASPLAQVHEAKRALPTKEERRKAKKARTKAQKKALKQGASAPEAAAAGDVALAQALGVNVSPRGFYDVYGVDARASIELRRDVEGGVRLDDVRGLVLWAHDAGTAPRFAFLRNKPLVRRTLLISAGGLDAHTYESRPDLFEATRRALGEPIELDANPVLDPVGATRILLSVPMDKQEKKASAAALAAEAQATAAAARAAARAAFDALAEGRPPPAPPSTYVLTPEQRSANLYPCDAHGDAATDPEYVTTLPLDALDGADREAAIERARQLASVHLGGGVGSDEVGGRGARAAELAPHAVVGELLFAVDCEMVRCASGSVLARATLVDAAGRVLLDELVAPTEDILDYCTRWSGITPQLLSGVSTRLADVQQRIRRLVPAEALLVGHSLENDLRALKLHHANVVDTAVLYQHPGGRSFKHSLRRLTEHFLGRSIQGSADGHDSAEDARATLELALLKVARGGAFGGDMGGRNDRASRQLCDVIAAGGTRAALVDRPRALDRHATGGAQAVAAVCDDDVVARAIDECKGSAAHAIRAPSDAEGQSTRVSLVWAHLAELAAHQQKRVRKGERLERRHVGDTYVKGELSAAEPTRALREQDEAALRALDKRIGDLCAAAPQGTLVVVTSAHGDSAYVRRLQEARLKLRRDVHVEDIDRWDDRWEQELKQAKTRAGRGLAFATCT